MKQQRIVVNDTDYGFPLRSTDDYLVAAAKTVSDILSLSAGGYLDFDPLHYDRMDLFRLVLRGIVSRNQRRPFNNHNWVGAFNHSMSAQLLYPELCQ